MASAKDFLYHRKGPWPQPSPDHPFGEAPAVLRIPMKERVNFALNVGTRYAADILFRWPQALVYALTHPGLEEVSDEEMGEIIVNSPFARMLNPVLDAVDKENFKDFLSANPGDYFKIDLSPMEYVDHTYKGLYSRPSVSLYRKESDTQVTPVAIFLNDLVITPENKEAWELGKYYVLNGCAVCGTLVNHPLLHFPMDAINAVTKTALPMNHPVFKLIYPHCNLSLPLSQAVLDSKGTVLAKNNDRIYGPYSAPIGDLRDLIVAGYKGMPDNSSYPGYKYLLGPEKIFGNYGQFLTAYYDVIFNFVSKMISKTVSKGDINIIRWANYIAPWIPGFPTGEEIFNGDTLERTVTGFIWDVTVAHALDHESFGRLDVNKVPMRMRVPPPNSLNMSGFDKDKVVKTIDTMKYEMAMIMFYRPSNVTLMKDVVYDFDEPWAHEAINEYKQALRDTDRSVNKRLIALDEISASVQY